MSRAVDYGRVVLRGVDAVTPALALVAVIGLVTGATIVLGDSLILQRQAITMLIYVVTVVGLYTFVGNSGVLSFGHITFMAIGAYVTAFSTMPSGIKHAVFSGLPEFIANIELQPLPGLLLGAVAATVVALLIAFPINRLPGISLGLAMFALLLTINVVTRQATALVSGGQTSIFGIPEGTTMLSAFVLASLSIMAAYAFQGSRAGIRLRAAREDEYAARASGINITRRRVVAFLISAFLVGLGGGMFVQFLGALSPDTLFFDTTMITLAMLVVGGIGSLSGAVTGTVILSAVVAWLRELEDGFNFFGVNVPDRAGLTAVGLGVVMLVSLLFRPQGLTGSKEVPPISRWRLTRRKDRSRSPAPPTGVALEENSDDSGATEGGQT